MNNKEEAKKMCEELVDLSRSRLDDIVANFREERTDWINSGSEGTETKRLMKPISEIVDNWDNLKNWDEIKKEGWDNAICSLSDAHFYWNNSKTKNKSTPEGMRIERLMGLISSFMRTWRYVQDRADILDE